MRWLVENWHALLARPWDTIALVLLAVASGAWVGTATQRKEKAVGVRTMAFVALGSCTFTLVGHAFTSNIGDSGRVAAQIVTGIGFLGAGLLLHGSGGVEGMITVATIWVTAAIGMTFGAGHVGAALGLALLTWGVLTMVGHSKHSDFGGARESMVSIFFNPDHGKASIKLENLLAEFSISGRAVQRGESDKEREQWSIHYRLPERGQLKFLAALAQLPEVIAIERPPLKLERTERDLRR